MRRRVLVSGELPYVEIGGIKWATMNIGAETETDYGLYFQCGDTQGYTEGQCGSGDYQKPFVWADYKFGNGTASPTATKMVKYNSSDAKTTLELSDDAARLYLGGNWRLPTYNELTKLTGGGTYKWESNYNNSGIAGVTVTSKTDSSKKIFLPASGYLYNGSATNKGSNIYVVSSSIDTNRLKVKNIAYSAGGITTGATQQRNYGFTLRPILDE